MFELLSRKRSRKQTYNDITRLMPWTLKERKKERNDPATDEISSKIIRENAEVKRYNFRSLKHRKCIIHFPLMKMLHLANEPHRRDEANEEIIIARRYRYNLLFFSCKMSLA